MKDQKADSLRKRSEHLSGVIYMAYQTLLCEQGELQDDIDVARRVGRVLREVHADLEKIIDEQYNYNFEHNNGTAETTAICRSQSKIHGLGHQERCERSGSNPEVV